MKQDEAKKSTIKQDEARWNKDEARCWGLYLNPAPHSTKNEWCIGARLTLSFTADQVLVS